MTNRFDDKRAEDLERLFFPGGAPLVAPDGPLLAALRGRITERDLADATATALTGRLP